MNAAAELLDKICEFLPPKPAPEDIVGKVVRRGFETYEVLAFDEPRGELTVRDTNGKESSQSVRQFYRKLVREVQPREKPFRQPGKEAPR
jgi:hypothetical protein